MINIFDYINSKDIANHLKNIGYQFSTLEMVWIISNHTNLTYDKRKELYLEIITSYKNIELSSKYTENRSYKTLSAYLDLYIKESDKAIESFKKEDPGCVYKYIEYTKNGKYVSEDLYTTYNELIDNLDPFDDSYYIECIKFNTNTKEYINVLYNIDKSIHSYYADYSNKVIDTTLLENLCLNIPLPFKYGDLIYSKTNSEVYVYEGNNLEEDKYGIIEDLDISDMYLSIIKLKDNSTIIDSENLNHCIDIEYYTGVIEGRNKILKSISDYYKGGDIIRLLLEHHNSILEIESSKYKNEISDYK